MHRKRDRLIVFLLDFAGIELAFFLAFFLRFRLHIVSTIFSPSVVSYIMPSIYVSAFFLLLFAFFGLYDRPNWVISSLDEAFSVFKAISLGVLIIAVLFTDLSNLISLQRVVLYMFWAGSFIITMLFRTIYRKLILSAHRYGKLLIPTLIIGDTEKAERIKKELENFPVLGYNIVSVIPYKSGTDGEDERLEDLPKIIQKFKIEEIILAISTRNHEEILKIMDKCGDADVSFKVVPDMYDLIAGQKQISIFGAPLVELFSEPLNPFQKIMKRAMDIVVSFFALILSLPIFLVLLVAIPLDSPGPVFYKQLRVGKRGRLFWLYKFRTMYNDAERMTGPVWAKKDDPRITRLGRFLRKMRIDEIPQFLNVLRGDMSLVGPRPEREFFVNELKNKIPLYTKRLLVKPGLTGWAQIKHKYDASLDDVAEKLKYDFYYIENMSILMDIKILLRTVLVVLSGKGAH